MREICYRCLKDIGNEEIWHGLHKACFKDWFKLEKLNDFTNLTVKTSASSPTTFASINSSFYHGKFKKYSAELGDVAFILKVQMPEYPELPFVEFLSNQIAGDFGIDVPDFFLINFNGIPTFATKNFIKKTDTANLIHIYRYLKNPEEFDCSTIARIIGQETGRLLEIERFLELCLFDSLIGNDDRHGRNIAIIESPGRKRLSPFYDNPSSIGVELKEFLGADLNPRGKIFTSTAKEPTIKDYVAEIKKLGHPGVIDAFNRKLDLSSIEKRTQESFLSQKRKEAFLNLIEKRYEEFRKSI